MQRLDVGVQLGLPQRDLLCAQRLALLVKAPALVAGQLELQLLDERRRVGQLLGALRQFAVALGEDALLIEQGLVLRVDRLVTLLELTEQRHCERFELVWMGRYRRCKHA